MMIGLTGASCTGKTTLAMEAAAQLGFHYCKTSVSDVYKRLGKDPAVRMSFDERMDCQEAILNELRIEWQSYKGDNAITDRTPICLIAYTLADVDSYDALTAKQEDRLAKYIGNCIGVYAKFFDKLVIVPNKLKPEIVPDKVRANMTWGYRNKYEILLRGICAQYGALYSDLFKVDLQERVEELRSIVA